MSLFLPASDKITADRTGTPLEVNENLAPTADGPAGHPVFTDLGGLDHLFRDPVESIFHTVSVPLEQATMATAGPHGGLQPGYLQGRVTAARVDGEELVARSIEPLKGPGLLDEVRRILDRIRVSLLRS